ncbi:hypothetical protein [Methylobacterium sp. E-045]|uniref:hypothetical protein n=1 Tax=Methylobacterium sp. E-045 TaxID=2836575 RepID=UPI001FBA2769|nr:hypothetical protein [Methylobacterium sp. E-045]MCJ2132210.1 hypothetical protein [Methylobacterium sp. E-045]
MDADDKDLGFAASLLAHAAGKGGLTAKQEKYGLRVVHRLYALWEAKALACQQPRSEPSKSRTDLASMPTEGRA